MVRKTINAMLILLGLFVSAGMVFFLFYHIPSGYGIILYFGLYSIAAIAMVIYYPKIDSISGKMRRAYGGVSVLFTTNLTVRICLILFTAIVCGAYALNVRLFYEGDISGLLYRSIGLTEGTMHDYRYAAVFPHILRYPAFVSVFMKIFGKSVLVNIAINQIAVIAAVQLVFSYLKLYVHPKAALAGALSAALNPTLWIYANTPNAELLFGVFALAALYCFSYGTVGNFKKVFVGASLALCAAAQYFRPLGIIALIALLISLITGSGIKPKYKAILTAGGIGFFILCSILSSKMIPLLTDHPVPKKSYGWNLYVGASEHGTWNAADGEVFQSVFENTTTTDEVQNYFAKKAFERYAKMGAGIPVHLFKKLWIWTSSDYIRSVAALERRSGNGFDFGNGSAYRAIIYIYNALMSLFAAMAVAVLPIIRLRKKETIEPALYFFAGSVLLMMFTEIAERYTIGYRFLYSIFAVQAFSVLLHNRKTGAPGSAALCKRQDYLSKGD